MSIRQSTRCAILAISLAWFPSPADAQSVPVATVIYIPALPRPQDDLRVVIRVAYADGSPVRCPESSPDILGFTITGTAVRLNISGVGSPGGFHFPYCDSNVVSLGRLPAGRYDLEARYVTGTILGPVLTTSTFTVAAANAGPLEVPASSWWSLGMLALGICALPFVRRISEPAPPR